MPTELVNDMQMEDSGSHVVKPHSWVELHANYLYAYALSRLNDEEIARDVLQETFLSALEKKDSFRGDSSERTWLTAIIRHKIIDIYRKKNIGLANTDMVIEDEAVFFDPDLHNWKREYWPVEFANAGDDPLHNKEFARVLQQCMRKLPALWISVFTMKHIDDEATETICADLRITSANFWVIMHRAKVNLRSCLQKNWL